jgi:hypothetical protein
MNLKNDQYDSLHWQAQCYALGELSEDDARRFEEELEHCPIAQDALAESMALLVALKSCCSVTAVKTSYQEPVRSPARRWVPLVAGLIVAVGSWVWYTASHPSNHHPTLASDLDREWVREVPSLLASLHDDPPIVEETVINVDLEASEDIHVPAWLLQVTAERLRGNS